MCIRDRTYTVHTLDEMKETADRKPGLIRAMWCGDLECELKLKEEAGVSSRCMPFEQEAVGDRCVSVSYTHLYRLIFSCFLEERGVPGLLPLLSLAFYTHCSSFFIQNPPAAPIGLRRGAD